MKPVNDAAIPSVRRVRARTTRLIRIVVVVTLLSAAVGAVFARAYDSTAAGLARGVLTGALDGAVLTSFEIALATAVRIRRRPIPVLAMIMLKTVVYGAVFLGAFALGTAVVDLAAPGEALPYQGTLRPPIIALSFGIGLAMNFMAALRTLLGPRTLMALATGRYRQPHAEERVVLFLDLRGSTALAERLGDAGFHRFLNRVFFDITDPVLESGGEIYRYVGDEIIVTWIAGKRGTAASAVACVFAIVDALTLRRADYVAAFGTAPELRGALHQRPLVVGEMGDVKREIVMLGDTMNTTARIEEACRTTGRDYIASAPLVRAAEPFPAGCRAESLGSLELRGKEGATELFALTRA
jgi:adenylate cyclase